MAFWKPGSTAPTLDRSSDLPASHPAIHNKNRHLSLRQQRERLPIAVHRDELLWALERYRVVVVAGETGCGKSTQIPQYLHQGGWTAGNRCVVCTQPRSLSVMATAARVADELGLQTVGGLVGFSTHYDHRFSDETRMKFCTDRFLIQEMMFNPLLEQYSVIMVDEAHERKVHTDVLLGLLRMLLKRRNDFRVIVASATMDVPLFVDYFKHLMVDTTKTTRITSSSSSSLHSLKDVVSLFVGRRQHHIDTQFLLESCGNYLLESVRTVIKIHQTERPGAILVFLPDKHEVMDVVDKLNEWYDSQSGDNVRGGGTLGGSSSIGRRSNISGRILVVPLHIGMSSQDQLRAMRPSRPGERKIVVSDGIAESSLTIDDIVYVVDCCYDRIKYFDPISNTEMLVTESISRASAVQRAGRAGRTKSGKCYHLCTLKSYNELLSQSTVPQIERTNLTEIVLQMKALGVNDILHFPYLSPPPVEILIHALDGLYALGALDERCSLTNVGHRMADFPCSPEMTRMLMAAIELTESEKLSGDSGETVDCIQDTLSLAGMLSLYNIFTKCKTATSRQQRDLSHQQFAVQRGDHCTLIEILREYENSSNRSEFAAQHFLSVPALNRAIHVRDDLRRHLSRVYPSVVKRRLSEKQRMNEPRGTSEQILKCVLTGYFRNIARLHGSGKYCTVKGNALVQINQDSVLEKFASGRPVHWIVYHEIQNNNHNVPMIYDVSWIDPRWVMNVAPHYFKKQSGNGGIRSGTGGGSLYYADRFAVERSNQMSEASSTLGSSGSSTWSRKRTKTNYGRSK
jgi:ATP-dependent RNA helicase DDX35